MRVRLRLFSTAKEIAGFDEKDFEVEEHANAGALLKNLVEAHPELAAWEKSVRMAVNLEYVPLSHRLSEGDEVAVIPPVSGG